jgi:uncharacterized heparinase superfamily protein
MVFSRLRLYWRTLRYLKAKQVFYLLIRRVFRLPRASNNRVSAYLRPGFSISEPMPLEGIILDDDDRFIFLNQSYKISGDIDWSCSERPALWRYNLHYFDYLRQPNLQTERGLQLIEHWILSNSDLDAIGWDPYPTSLRIVNWLFFVSASEVKAHGGSGFVESLGRQADWLSRNLEHHISANHFFENAKALVFAGAYMGGPFGDKLLRTGMKHLREQLPEQFMADGGHYERSPMYHAILTADLLDLFNLYTSNPGLFSGEDRRVLEGYCQAALQYFFALRSPDGSVPFFNDAANGIAPSYARLRDYANRLFEYKEPNPRAGVEILKLESSGYFVIREHENMVIIDCGQIGPDYQPGHAHCDTLSYEYFLNGHKWITNVGSFDYEPSAERHYARSTAAHNTVEIDGEEQSEVWGAFRVGHRAKPFSARLDQQDDRGARFVGSHDGYERLKNGVVHERAVDYESGGMFKVEDRISGNGIHRAVSYIHFVPGIRLEKRLGGLVALFDDGKFELAIVLFGEDEFDVISTDRYPEFGIKQTGDSLKIVKSAVTPFVFGYKMTPELVSSSS